MSVITIFSGVFCGELDIITDVIASTGYRSVTDSDILLRAQNISGVSKDKLRRAFSSKTSVFNKFTQEKECSIAYLRLAVAELLAEDNLAVCGFSGLLIPRDINHVIRICLIAEMKYRVQQALEKEGLSEKEAKKSIRLTDGDQSAWTNTLFSQSDPWENSLYDIVIPMSKMDIAGAGVLIEQNMLKNIVRPTAQSQKAVKDFLLAAKVEVALSEQGHIVSVSATDGAVILSINKHVLMLSRLEDELKFLAEKVPGVVSVKTREGKDCHRLNIYRKQNFEVPSKVLLVDDEREFVQTLSERLQLRDMGSAVAYDGESALSLIKEDEPEVMIIDLKMPGIDGLEILKKVKATQPQIEVIVLTGHGCEADRKQCMDLGAFAYMQKPVDINLLGEALKKAHEKLSQNRKK
ncbi:MAG: response regulator [Deltaproteobacteria bacterium]|nr:response regulator [Deltaproteobacteria bacterium]